jgi:hypothetical protein
MSARRWFILTIATIAAGVALTAASAYLIDPYGMWRNPSGRRLAAYYSERKVKFLLTKRYVPTNFEGLTIGPSNCMTWNIQKLTGARMYNECQPGGNAAEMQLIVDQALPLAHFKIALIVLHPTATHSADFHDGLETTPATEGMWSIHVLVHELAYMLRAGHVHFPRDKTPDDGMVLRVEGNGLKGVPLSDQYFYIDPQAVADYRRLTQDLQSRGTTVIYVIPPIYQACYDANKAAYQKYATTLVPQLPPAPLIDFDGSEYADFRSNVSNFHDCHHVNLNGAAEIDAILERLVPPLLSHTAIAGDRAPASRISSTEAPQHGPKS